MNLQACLAAKKKSAIGLAAGFIRQASGFVRDGYWATNYEETLEVYTLSAEIEFSIGHFDEAKKWIDHVETHGKNVDDIIRVLIVKMQSFGARRLFAEAIKEASKALQLLGEKIPKSSALNFMIELWKTKKAVSKKADSFFETLRPMTDSRKIWAMKILQAGSVVSLNMMV